MINRPCPSKVNCGVCPEFASPYENLSSEAPDPIDFIAMGFYEWTPPINGGANNVGGTGGQNNWVGNRTVGKGTSIVNQQQAQEQANRNAFNSAVNPIGRSTTQTVYGNTAQTVTIPCGSGSTDFTYTVPPDTFVALDQGLADQFALDAAQEAAPEARICITTLSVPGSCLNESYSTTLVATGGTLFESGYYLWQVTSGSLPDGLSLDPETGEISGTPTTIGSYSFTVTVADYFFNTSSKTYTLTVAEITTSTLPSGIVGTAYSQTIAASPAGGTFALVSGALPAGLTLSSGGAITGTPTAGANGDYLLPVSYTLGGTSCIKTLALKIWDSENISTPFTVPDNGVDNTLGSFGPGKFEILYNTGARGILIDKHPGGFYLAITGGGPLSCPDMSPIVITGAGAIDGVINQAGVGTPDYATAIADTQGLNPMATFELLVSTSIHYTWPAFGPTICTGTISSDIGGSSPSFFLHQIGKP